MALTDSAKVTTYMGGGTVGTPEVFLRYLWGDGSDGDYVQDGGTVYDLLGVKQYKNITLTNGAQLVTNLFHFLFLRATGIISLSGNSAIYSILDNTGTSGGIFQFEPINGAPPVDQLRLGENTTSGFLVNICVSGGGGGGGGASKTGGAGGTYLATVVPSAVLNFVYGVIPTNGGAANGNGGSAQGLDSKGLYIEDNFDYFTCPMMLGLRGGPGGSGGVDYVGTGASKGRSGAGGTGGRGGGFLDVRARTIIIEEGSSINCNGLDGGNGGNAINSTNADANAGGGGGGSGGSGGTVRVLCNTIDADSKTRITATGGAAGVYGVGCGTGKRGGNGAAGFNGLVAITTLGD